MYNTDCHTEHLGFRDPIDAYSTYKVTNGHWLSEQETITVGNSASMRSNRKVTKERSVTITAEADIVLFQYSFKYVV